MSRPIAPLHLVKPRDGASQRFLGPYLLKECIGQGGTAIVYKGLRTGAAGFEKQVVVKTILPELARDPRFLALFTEEAKLSAQLFHANICQLQDFGVIRGTPFLELELLSGWNLKQLFDATAARGARVPVAITLHVLTEACRGLAYAHSFVDANGALRPIIHRDVTPSNVMICRDGAVKLLDFGLASLTRGETLRIETFQGKLAYMSPEQVERFELDRSADVFAMGVVLYELLTGRRLFAGDTDEETVRRVRACEVPPPSSLNREVPRALDEAVLRALDRDPARRYRSAVELLEALERLRLRPAPKRELLSYLGQVAPAVFTRSCDRCGRSVPQGRACFACHVPEPPQRHLLALVRTPSRGVPAWPLEALPRILALLALVRVMAGRALDVVGASMGRIRRRPAAPRDEARSRRRWSRRG